VRIDYTPPPTLARFMRSPKRVRAVRGPVGSGKSTAMVIELFRRGIAQAPSRDGIRRTRNVIVRNTLQQLKTTALPTIEQTLRGLTHYKVSDQKVIIEFDDVHMEWLFLPLDTPENIQRLLSLELTYGWLSEFREIDAEIAMNVLSRCGRFPSKLDGGPTDYGLIMESNSFSEDSEWFDHLEKDLPDNWGYFVQPPGLPAGENLENLPPMYYADLMESNTEDWVDQYVYNQIGPSLSGQAVFRATFSSKDHLTELGDTDGLEYIPNRPMVCGLDVGRNPAALFGQMDPKGRVAVLRECFAENKGIEKFVIEDLRPLMFDHFPAAHVIFVIDPTARNKSQIGEESVFTTLRRLGFSVVLASTNFIDPRLRAVEQLFNRREGIIIDRYACPFLVRALQHEYRYKRKKSKQLDETPEKLHPWSDLADGFQYLCLGIDSRAMAQLVHRVDPANSAEKMPTGAWT